MKKLSLIILVSSLWMAGVLTAEDTPAKQSIPVEFRKHVTDSRQLPTEKFDWGTLTWLGNATLFPGALQTVGIAEIFPGKRNTVHFHPNCEEVLYVISGRGRHSFDDRAVDLTPGMTIRIPSGVKHNLFNFGTKTLTVMITFSTGERKTVFLKD